MSFTAPLAAQTQQSSRFLERGQDLSVARAFHGAAVLRDFIYVFGGTVHGGKMNNQPSPSVEFARILPDGRLSKWTATEPLPQPRHYISNSTVVLNDVVYVIGGSMAASAGARINTVAWSTPGPDGSLAPWKESQPFGEAGLSCTAAFATPGHLFMTGGLTFEDVVKDTVWSVRVLPDGSLGDWEASAPLPIPLWYHHAAVVAGRAYIWGGLQKGSEGASRSASTQVFSAAVMANGKLGAWRTEAGALNPPFYSASSASAGPYLFSFSPRYSGGNTSNDVWWTVAGPDGLAPWRKQATEVSGRVYHAVAPDFRRGTIYFLGGKPKGSGVNPTEATYVFRLGDAARRKAEQTWAEQSAAHLTVSTEAKVQATPAPGSTEAPITPSSTPFAKFVSFESALAAAAGSKVMAVYFHIPGAKPCVEQNELFSTAEFQALATESVVFAEVDVRRYPQLGQQWGVFRSPTWIFFSSFGDIKERHVGKMTAQQIAESLRKAQ